jgi:SAM-dependent methyltransferase
MMTKAYESHEAAYRRLRLEKKFSWSDLPQQVPAPAVEGVDVNDERFFVDALDQSWAPKSGSCLELGCGTGPMLRWFCRKGFSGLGVDVSPTAIKMAKEQSGGLDVDFMRADVVEDSLGPRKGYDIVLDGRCLHCLTKREDRNALLKKVRAVLKSEGVFIAISMCGPIDRKIFARIYPEQRVTGSVLYVPFEGASRYEDGRTIGIREYAPIRYVVHWQRLLNEFRRAGLIPRLIRLSLAAGDEATGFLYAACVLTNT